MLRPAPIIKARYAPVYWEPVHSVGERFISIVVVQPLSSESVVQPTARVVLSIDRLKVMFGRSAKQVHGIMAETADFLTHLLESGVQLESLAIPFTGFKLGEIRLARGRTIEQMLDGAVRSISSLGAADALYKPTSLSIRRQTQATASFIQRIRRDFADGDPERKQRFRRTLFTQEAKVAVTLDYAFEQWLVQVASLPHSRYQEMLLRREAESKMFELQAAQSEFEGNAKPVLLINATALDHPANDEAALMAAQAHEHIQRCAALVGAEVLEARSAIEGVHALEALN